ncbi:MAG: ribbon-helix-helix domain-containing protein [Candidatus Woesearchaeota archaeon]|nr:ribbon-helix-helix domain-containing protein [Candidatus Woesearchaeota archaeon]
MPTMKKDRLIHIRIGEQLRKDIEELIEQGIFSSQTELAREAIRTLILKYKEQYEKIGERKRK